MLVSGLSFGETVHAPEAANEPLGAAAFSTGKPHNIHEIVALSHTNDERPHYLQSCWESFWEVVSAA